MHTHHRVPAWSWLAPALAGALVLLKLAGLVPVASAFTLLIAAMLLGAVIFASVHHAEVLASRVGEPAGSIILALAVTIIEVAMIASIMLADSEGSDVVARDTVFSAVMIVLNGVVGLCLVLGGRRHHEQRFRLDAASSALAVLGVLATLVLVLPNYVRAGGARQFSSPQLMVAGAVTFLLYGVFLFVQTVRHRDYFMQEDDGAEADEAATSPPGRVTLASAVLLPLALAMVIGLAKLLSQPLDAAVRAAGLPQAFVGVVIAAIVLTPEAIASTRAAIRNRLQNSINLVLGSALASIGLTIPAVTVIASATGRPLTLGLEPQYAVLLVLSLFVSTITLGTGRTTVLQGAVHLAIFAVFVTFSAMP